MAKYLYIGVLKWMCERPHRTEHWRNSTCRNSNNDDTRSLYFTTTFERTLDALLVFLNLTCSGTASPAGTWECYVPIYICRYDVMVGSKRRGESSNARIGHEAQRKRKYQVSGYIGKPLRARFRTQSKSLSPLPLLQELRPILHHPLPMSQTLISGFLSLSPSLSLALSTNLCTVGSRIALFCHCPLAMASHFTSNTSLASTPLQTYATAAAAANSHFHELSNARKSYIIEYNNEWSWQRGV